MAQRTPSFLHLPTDIIDVIIGKIRILKDLANFAYCNTAAHRLAEPLLWHADTQAPGRPALYWGIEKKDVTVIRKALDEYTRLGARHLLDGTDVQWSSFAKRNVHDYQDILGSPVMLAVKSGSLELLELVVNHAAQCSLDVRWCAHPSCPCRSETANQFVGPHKCERLRCRHPAFPTWDGQAIEGYHPNPYRLGNDLFGCQTALHWAIWTKRPYLLRCLLQQGLNAGLEPGTERIISFPSCMVSLLHTVIASAEKLSLSTWGLPATSDFNITATHISMMEILLDHGANPNLIYDWEPHQPTTYIESPLKVAYWTERGHILNWLLDHEEDEAARFLIHRGAKWWWPNAVAEDDERLQRDSPPDIIGLRPLCVVALRRKNPLRAIGMIDFMLDGSDWDGSTQPLTDALLCCLGRLGRASFGEVYPDARDCSTQIALHLIYRGAVTTTPKRLEWIARYFPKWGVRLLLNPGKSWMP